MEKGSFTKAFLKIDLDNNGCAIHGEKAAFLGYKLESDNSGCTNGIYAQWALSNGCLTATNDMFGFYPVFYCANQRGFSISSSLTELLEEDSFLPFDDAAMAVFLRMGNFLGDDTPFRDIRRMPPGVKLSWGPNGLSITNDNDFMPKLSHLSRDRAIKNYGEVFQTAIEKYVLLGKEKIGLPLSGGRDSRHILLALFHAGVKPHSCLTMKHIPPKTDEDTRIAAKVSSALGAEHITIEYDNAFLKAELRKNLLTDFCSFEHSWLLPLSSYLKREKYDVIFDGIGGDVLSAGLFLTVERHKLYEAGDLDALAENLLGPEGSLPILLTRAMYQKWNREIAIDRVKEELRKYLDTPNPVSQFIFWNRTRRHIANATWGILGNVCHVFAPYLNREVYMFLSSLPASYFIDHSFHTEAINRYYRMEPNLPFETKSAEKKSGRYMEVFRFVSSLVGFFLPSILKPSAFRRRFVYTRLFRSLLMPEFGFKFISISRKAVYLHQMMKLGFHKINTK